MPDIDHRIKNYEHPQALGSLRSWIRLLRQNRDVDLRYLPRLTVVTFFSLITSPLRVYERLRYGAQVKNTPIHPAPIYIIGHWRSGTTHLQNLLCQDPQFSYVSTFQAMVPGFFLTGNGPLKHLLDWITDRLYQTRLIDNVPLLMDSPQEEEYAMANLTPYSILHWFSFPRKAQDFFHRYVLLEDITGNEMQEWEQLYLEVLRKTSLVLNGKRPVLKNPAHSGRLTEVLRLFPEAKFIHLLRNPYDVFLSTRHLFQVVLPRSQLHRISPGEVDLMILEFYPLLMRKLLEDKKSIPPDNLVELKFEQVEQSPIEQISRLYHEFDLPGFEQARPALQSYLASIAGYQKNQYRKTQDVIDLVNQHWGFAFDAFGYERL